MVRFKLKAKRDNIMNNYNCFKPDYSKQLVENMRFASHESERMSHAANDNHDQDFAAN